MKRIVYACIVACSLLLGSCAEKSSDYKIGVSQCAGGNWREKVNSELLSAQHLYDVDVEVDIACAYDDTERQIHQIDSLVEAGIDLLVVAPNESAPITQAIIKAHQKGIPVIFFDRKAETNDFTAFIGGNNVEAGKIVANYALQTAKSESKRKKPVIMEITATMGTSPARERHLGFSSVITQHPEVDYLCINSDWSDTKAYEVLKKQIKTGQIPDIVFCHSDYMGRGCHKALKEAGLLENVKVLGVDGLPGKDEGIEAVQMGKLAGTYIYPTHGEEIVRLALKILTKQPFERENFIPGTMVTPQNADLLAMNSNELLSESNNLIAIQKKLEEEFSLVNSLTKAVLLASGAIILLIAALFIYMRAIKQTKKAHKRMKQLNKEQTAFYTNASHQLRTPLTLIAGPVKQLLNKNTLNEEDRGLLEIVNRNVSQLESLISDVLNFKKSTESMKVCDASAIDALEKTASEESIQKGRVSILKQDESDELSTVLIVEDNNDMRKYIRTLLADRYYVLEATDGQSGLKLAKESVPDLIVSDVMMPIMDGLQLCKKLKEDVITSHIPVILLTARSTEAHQMEGYDSGADAYLTKPFSAELLISRIANLLKNRKQLKLLLDGKQNEESKEKISTPDRIFIDNLKEAIKKNMSNPNLRMDDLGDEIGLSRVQMYRKVKVLTGLSPTELLRQMRLQRAAALLSSTTKTVAEIAFEVGFNTPGYFSKCFKEQYGKQPTDLRAN